ncbi:family 78 glycoside hydrolase catalytic domain, partial [Streptosporangium fragile]|uniref:family 78 glycoside hydrolase catalytic domain n=1 Tax=Streptosporangium fragile TaxID=46186 RepID=UPI0031E4FA3E
MTGSLPEAGTGPLPEVGGAGAAGGTGPARPGDGAARLGGLRAEHRTTPIGLDVVPRFSWIVTSGARACAQLSYRVVVAGPGAPVWDSGEVPGPRSYEVEYEGPPLAPLTRYEWEVTVRTTHGDAHARSWFVTGPLTEADWGGAAWIGRERARPAAPLLRTEFAVDGEVRSALLVVAAGGYADVSVNGERPGADVLSPGFTDYEDRVQYVAFEVAHLLRSGANAIGLELGRGFYGVTGANTWDWHTAPWHGEPCARVLLHLGLAGGRTRKIVSSPAWRRADGPTRYDDPYGGESYDARHERPGYDRPGFDDAGWRPADVLAGPSGRLVNQRQQPVRVVEELPVDQVTEPLPGVYVARVPRVVAGWLQVRATGAAGSTVTLRYGERLTERGLPNYEDEKGYFDGRFQTDEFTLAGTGEPECWEPKFSWKGFQYVEITGWPEPGPPPPGRLVAKVVHTDAAVTGRFDCAEPTLARLHDVTVATVLNNLHGIPTDTPKFEKNGWTGDGMLGAEMFLRNLDIHEFLAKWVDDIADTRDGGGAPEVIAPHGGWHLDWSPAPPWHAAYVLIPWWIHRYTGDVRVLREHYAGMRDYLEFELGRSPGGIADTTLGDWVSPETDPGGGNAPEDPRVAATAYLYAMLTALADVAGILGLDGDVRWLRARAGRVRAAFRERFLDAGSGCVRGEGDSGFRQTHNVLALAFGLLEEAERAGVAARVAADVSARGHLNTGALGTKYLLPVLTDHGHGELALAVALRPEFPGWAFWLEQGATTLWEHWSAASRSRGHYFLGTVDDWLFTHVAGLRQGTPDADTLTVRPALTRALAGARAEVVTPRGTAGVAWRRDGDALTVGVTVPVGARAYVHLPAAPGDLVTEGGVPCAEAEGVEPVRETPEETVVLVRAGTYSFTVA